VLLDSSLELIVCGEVLATGANHPAQVQLFSALAGARLARAEMFLDSCVPERIKFTIDISRKQVLSFFTSHIVCAIPCGRYLLKL